MHHDEWSHVKTKKWHLLGSLEEPSDHFGFPIAWLFILFPTIAYQSNFSDLGANEFHVARTLEWPRSGCKQSIFAEAECTSSICAAIFRFCYCCLCMKVSYRASSWHSGSVLLVWALILMTAISEGRRIAVRRSFTCCPFLIGVPEGARKPLCFHNISKSWMTQKAHCYRYK